ncbi:MAG: CPBP family intramembrane metalloprotease [Sphingomonadales bacterium]|nr:CPBP family intramembrane metalloprotease [Sphingomonadales bacterium]
MDAADARALVAEPMSLRARVGDALRFMVRPGFVARPAAWGSGAAMALAAIIALDLALDTLAVMLTAAWDTKAGFLPRPIEEDVSLSEDIFASLLLAPVLEELLFRGWLTGRIAALRFAAYGFASLALFIISLFLPPDLASGAAIVAVAVVLAGCVRWSLTHRRDTAVPAWFARHFRWFVWGSTLVFGLIHLGNYEPLAHSLGVLVVLPQTIGGLLLAYTRTRLGLGAAMAHHAAYNALFLIGDYGAW